MILDGAPWIAADLAAPGGAAATPLLFLHGVGGNRANWEDQLAALSTQRLCVAMDIRGYGGSGDYDGPLDFRDCADDARRLLDHLGVARAHIVGLSMGGLIAQEFAAAVPARVASLILCDTGPGLFAHQPPGVAQEFLRLRRKPLEAGASPAEMAPAVADALVAPKADGRARGRLIDSMAALRAANYLKALEALVAYDAPPDLGRFGGRALVLCGADDRFTPPALSERLAARLPRAAMKIIPDAGHVSNIDNPRAFNAALAAFLEAAEKRSPGV